MIALALDTASELAGVGLFEDGSIVGEVTWKTHQNHSRELLPAVDWLLHNRGVEKAALGGIVICLGPGSYAGLRIGLSTAKALAFALGIPLCGIGRLAADAEPYAIDGGPPVFALQAAGRAELAWAGYQRRDGRFSEIAVPSLGRAPQIEDAIPPGSIICGDISESLAHAAKDRGFLNAGGLTSGRIVALGRLGAARLASGDVDAPASLVPMYLREPAIGPQPPVPET